MEPALCVFLFIVIFIIITAPWRSDDNSWTL